ncbi:MAG: acyl-CoA thioesterase [Candidatus Promineifilaceae bacterium]
MQGKRAAESRIELTRLMNVMDANMMGNVHGGIIMKLCDETGAMAAIRHAQHPVVTVAVDSMHFHSPVRIGDLLRVSAEVTWVGRTSLETRVVAASENVLTGETNHANTAYFVYVALDQHGRPTPVPPLSVETDEEKRRFEAGAARQEVRLQARD